MFEQQKDKALRGVVRSKAGASGTACLERHSSGVTALCVLTDGARLGLIRQQDPAVGRSRQTRDRANFDPEPNMIAGNLPTSLPPANFDNERRKSMSVAKSYPRNHLNLLDGRVQAGRILFALEHVPPQLNRGDSRGATDRRVYRH